jgi:hypothetical protein
VAEGHGGGGGHGGDFGGHGFGGGGFGGHGFAMGHGGFGGHRVATSRGSFGDGYFEGRRLVEAFMLTAATIAIRTITRTAVTGISW